MVPLSLNSRFPGSLISTFPTEAIFEQDLERSHAHSTRCARLLNSLMRIRRFAQPVPFPERWSVYVMLSLTPRDDPRRLTRMNCSTQKEEMSVGSTNLEMIIILVLSILTQKNGGVGSENRSYSTGPRFGQKCPLEFHRYRPIIPLGS